ncbi:DUF4148 domain-containing protein [Burkholderia ubonensis]|uniref:DUF4148 domain-containing protein n=1 Tax=Burkholderia ubonensis TaxID=101571 RepID=UPI0009B4DD7F|nr:DUF4148 domain-containing protein [Burkholderia ubonensis]
MKRAIFVATSMFVVLLPITIKSANALTREEVRAELAELRALGYRSMAEDSYYPRHTQEMMAKLHEKRMKVRANKVGDQVTPTRSSAGNRKTDVPDANRATDRNQCVGPVSFCNIYFGS